MENRRIPVRGAAGFLVHVLTASGGAVALLALYAAIERDFPATFGWLGLAMFIDGVDGSLARAARVTETAATIDGVILDLVIDFLAYVVAPVVALWRSDLMPTSVAFWIGLIVTIASALYFADTRMKTADHWFRGFPALWNVVVFYLFVLRPPWPIGAAAMLIGVGGDVRADRLRPSVSRRKNARADPRGDPRVVRAGRRGGMAAARRGPVGEARAWRRLAALFSRACRCCAFRPGASARRAG